MKTYIELWSAKDSWKSLSKEDRQNYLEQIGPALQGLMEQGVAMVSWGVNQDGTFARANYDFFSVMNFPDQKTVEDFEKIVEGAGWYNYFDQVNLCGEVMTPPDVIGKMINL